MTNVIQKFRNMPKALIVAGTLFLIVIGLVTALYFSSTSNAQETTWAQVQPQDIELRLGLVGRIESASRQTMAAPFEGVVEKVYFTDGAVVDAGDLLLAIETTQIDIQLRSALSELLRARQTMRSLQEWENGDDVARARRNVSTAELNFHDTSTKLKETRHLYDRGIVARMEVDSLEQQIKLQSADLVSAKSELRSVISRGTGEGRKIAEMELINAEARYDDLSVQKSKQELRAPVKGVALRPPKSDGTSPAVAIQSGQKVTTGMALVEVASVAHVHARVEESDLHVLHEGMEVSVTGDGFNGLTLQGKILSIGAQAISSGAVGSGGSYDVIVDVQPLTIEQQSLVRLGMSARLSIVTYSAKNRIVAPMAAVRKDNSGHDFISYRSSLQSPSKNIPITIGKVVPQGVEVTGINAGYVLTDSLK